MGGCTLSPTLGSSSVVEPCSQEKTPQRIVYEDVSPRSEAAWNANPAVNDSGKPYPPALPLHNEFNASTEMAPARREIAHAKEMPSTEKPTNFMSTVNHALLPVLGGGIGLGATALAFGGIPSVLAPLAAPACLTPIGAPVCLGAAVVGGAAGFALAEVGDGNPLSNLTLPNLVSGGMAGLAGIGNGWARAGAGFVDGGLRFYAGVWGLGRTTALVTELAQGHEPLAAAKNVFTDYVGMGLDVSAGKLGTQAGVAWSNKLAKNAAPELVQKLASQESKEVGNALVRLPGLQTIMDEGRRLFGETGRDFMNVIQKFRFNFDDENAIRAVFKGRGAELREFTSKVVEWASSSQDKLNLWNFPFARDSSVWNIASATSEGLRNLAGVGRRVLRQEALTMALQREMPYSMRVEVRLGFNDVVKGMRNLGKMLLSPEAKASPAWHDALSTAKFELGQGADQLVSGEVSRLYGRLFLVNRSPNMTVRMFVEEVGALQKMAEEFSEYMTPKARQDLAKLVDEAKGWAAYMK